MKQIAILGSTGSIGQSTLSIIRKYPHRFRVASLAAGRNLEAAFEQCIEWRPRVMSLATEELADSLTLRLKAAGVTGIEVVHGTSGT
ncbi:MAG: 1-deoxy-D-xylulose-5-phosphate reductoisomerase, partial [Silvibacterium sp.]